MRMKLTRTVVMNSFTVLLGVLAVVQQVYAQPADEEVKVDEGEEPLFQPDLAVGSVMIFLCAVISSGAGLGGGGLFIPVFLLILGYDSHQAVPLSKSTILGVAYGGYLVNYSRKHPLVDRPLIDYDIALLLQPMILMGTILGVSLNVIFPDILISILLVVLLTTVSYRSIRKGFRQYREETAAMEAEKVSDDKEDLQEGLLITPQPTPPIGTVTLHGNGNDSGSINDGSGAEKSESDAKSASDKSDSQESSIASSAIQAKKLRQEAVSRSIQHSLRQKKPTIRLSVSNYDRLSYSQGGGRLSILADAAQFGKSIDFEQYEDNSGDEADEESNTEEMLPVLEGGKESRAEDNAGTYESPRHVDSFDIESPSVKDDGGGESGAASKNKSEAVKQMLRDEAKTPWAKFGGLLAILLGLIILTILKGGAGDDSVIGVECGTAAYWVLVLLAVPYLGSFTYYFGKKRLRDATKKEEIDYPYVEGDIRWNKRGVLIYPCFAILAGTAAGCLGIGGGLVLGPLLLDIGVFPPVVTATSAFTIIFTATSVVSQFIVLGKLPFSHGAWYCAIGFISAILGHNFVKALVKKYKKNSMVSLVLGGAVGLSAVVLISTSVADLAKGGVDFKFNSLCDASAGE